LELGLDRRQIESAKALGRKIVDDPVLLRFVLCVLVLLLGWLAVLEPQAEALAAARKSLRKATKRADMAQELRFFESEKKRYEPLFFENADIVDWQRYVLNELEASGARLRSLEPKKTESKGNFKVLELSVDATGTYSQLVDFIDRLEHGRRVVRMTRMRLERRKDIIVLECVLNALVRPASKGGAEAGDDAPQRPAAHGGAEASLGRDDLEGGADAGPDDVPRPGLEPPAGEGTGSDGPDLDDGSVPADGAAAPDAGEGVTASLEERP
jgi:Tfp pilus assembly protein PilO